MRSHRTPLQIVGYFWTQLGSFVVLIWGGSFCERPKYWLCNLRQMANYTCSG